MCILQFILGVQEFVDNSSKVVVVFGQQLFIEGTVGKAHVDQLLHGLLWHSHSPLGLWGGVLGSRKTDGGSIRGPWSSCGRLCGGL